MVQKEHLQHRLAVSIGEPPEPLRLGYVHGAPSWPVAVQLHEPRRATSTPGAAILAVVSGGAMDHAITDLGGDLASAMGGPLYVVRPLKVPATLPGQLPADVLGILRGTCGQKLKSDMSGRQAADPCTLLYRQMGAALVAEAAERRCAAIVIGAPSGGWLARWRGHAVIRYLLRHARCHVYVVESVQTAPPCDPRSVLPN